MKSCEPISSDDAFSNVAIKYKLLFGLTSQSYVLLIGPYFVRYSNEFKEIFSQIEVANNISELDDVGQNDKKYDFVFADIFSESRQGEVRFFISKLKGWLNESSTLILVTANKLSLSRIKRIIKGAVVEPKNCMSTWGYKRRIKMAGFNSINEFMVFPSLQYPNEFVSTSYGLVQLPGYINLIYRFLVMLGLYRYTHEHYFYVATFGENNNLDSIASVISKYIYIDSEKENRQLLIERFDFRERGALILILRDVTNSTKYVVRMATSRVINSVIIKNMKMTAMIHESQSIPSFFKKLVPKTIVETEVGDCPVYVETMMPGIIAWKLKKGTRAEKTAYLEAFEFIYTFNLHTKKNILIDDSTFNELVGDDLNLVESAFGSTQEVNSLTYKIKMILRFYFLNNKIDVVWGHGDYGFGNILCSPVDGKIQGVIDWDTYKIIELPGIDYFNYIFQLDIGDDKSDISAVLSKHYNNILNLKSEGMLYLKYQSGDFGISTCDLIVYLCVAAIRYIKRMAPYRNEVILNMKDSVLTLRAVNDILNKVTNKQINE